MGIAESTQEARIAIRERRLVDARRLLRQIIREEPYNYAAWLLLARATPDERLALEYVNRARLLRPNSPLVQRSYDQFTTKGKASAGGRVINWRLASLVVGVVLILILLAAGLSQGAWEQVAAMQNQDGDRLTTAPADFSSGASGSSSQISQPPEENAGAEEPAAAIVLEAPEEKASPEETTPDLAPETGEDNESVEFSAEIQQTLTEPANVFIQDLVSSATVLKGGEAAPASSEPEAFSASTDASASIENNLEAVESDVGEALVAPEADVVIEPENVISTAASEADSVNNSDVGLLPGVNDGERRIDVNLTTQTLVAYEGNTPVFSSLISSGMWQFPTVKGKFRTWLKYESQDMTGYHLGYNYDLDDVPHVMYFYKDFAIHGTYWHNNFGTPMSHGCINMNIADAGWLYEWAPLGTLVNVHD